MLPIFNSNVGAVASFLRPRIMVRFHGAQTLDNWELELGWNWELELGWIWVGIGHAKQTSMGWNWELGTCSSPRTTQNQRYTTLNLHFGTAETLATSTHHFASEELRANVTSWDWSHPLSFRPRLMVRLH